MASSEMKRSHCKEKLGVSILQLLFHLDTYSLPLIHPQPLHGSKGKLRTDMQTTVSDCYQKYSPANAISATFRFYSLPPQEHLEKLQSGIDVEISRLLDQMSFDGLAFSARLD